MPKLQLLLVARYLICQIAKFGQNLKSMCTTELESLDQIFSVCFNFELI